MSATKFNLIDALSHLLTSIERGRAQMKVAAPLLEAFNDTRKRYESAVARWQEFADSRSSDKEELARHKSETQKLSDQGDEQWLSYKSATAFLTIFVDDFNLLLQRLPLKPGWESFRLALKDLRVGEPGAWMDPPTNPDLETLELRVGEMLALARSEDNSTVTQRTKIRALSLPTGTTWSNIEIRFLGDQQFQVCVGEQRFPPISFEEAGFADRRGRQQQKPIAAWDTLLALAWNAGGLTRPSMSERIGKRSAFEKRIEEIRERFKLLFGLPDDPFYPLSGDEYRLIAAISGNN